MSYAIIRNAKYKRENLMAVYRHDERKNKLDSFFTHIQQREKSYREK